MKLPAALALVAGAACTNGPPGLNLGTTQTSGTGPPVTPVGSCLHDGGSIAFQDCSTSNPCACPLGCIADPAFSDPVCELPCADPCPGRFALPGTSTTLPTSSACINAFCRLATCAVEPGGATVEGTYGGLCTAVAHDDGTCFPTGSASADGGASLWGVCLKGNVDGVCGPGPDPSCPPGSFCIAGGCRAACDPTASPSCSGGFSCQPFPMDVNPHAGYCGPTCSPDGDSCSGVCCNPQSACNGVCGPAD